MRNLLFLIILLLVLPIVYSEESVSLPVAYCTHLGYSIQINQENQLECVFDHFGSKCNAFDFYKGTCEEERGIEYPLIRKEGESVYIEFEVCEEGLIVSEPRYLLEQPKCVKSGFINTINNIIWKITNIF